MRNGFEGLEYPAPSLPQGYEALTPVEPLLTSRDALWAGMVRSQDGDGLLVLDESGRKVLEFVVEEAVSLLSMLLKWTIAGMLLEACSPEYLAEHSLDVEVVRALLSTMQLDFVQRFLEEKNNLKPGEKSHSSEDKQMRRRGGMMSNIFSPPDEGDRSIEQTPMLVDWKKRVTAASLAREAWTLDVLSPEPALLAQIAHLWMSMWGLPGDASKEERATLALAGNLCREARLTWDHEKALVDRLREMERRQVRQKEEEGPQPGEQDAQEKRYFSLLALEDHYTGALASLFQLAHNWERMADHLQQKGGRLEEMARSSLSLRYTLSYACEIQRSRLLQLVAFVGQRYVECQWERMDHLYQPQEPAKKDEADL